MKLRIAQCLDDYARGCDDAVVGLGAPAAPRREPRHRPPTGPCQRRSRGPLSCRGRIHKSMV